MVLTPGHAGGPPRYGHLLDRTALDPETILARLERHDGIPIVAGRYAIEATVAAAPLATHLALAAGAPVLLAHRTARTTGGDAGYYQQRHYRGDRVRYTLDLQRPVAGGAPPMVGLAPRLVTA